MAENASRRHQATVKRDVDAFEVRMTGKVSCGFAASGAESGIVENRAVTGGSHFRVFALTTCVIERGDAIAVNSHQIDGLLWLIIDVNQTVKVIERQQFIVTDMSRDLDAKLAQFAGGRSKVAAAEIGETRHQAGRLTIDGNFELVFRRWRWCLLGQRPCWRQRRENHHCGGDDISDRP